ncbi:MAG: GIY-YIG nuclease family protein [Bacilli bacterium]
MTCGIYMIQNKVNNKIYIGQAVDIEKRWRGHINAFKKGKGINIHFQNSWDKYGESNFEFTVICECNENQLNTMEEYYIFELMTNNSDFGYNKNYGGNGFGTNQEIRDLIGNKSKQQWLDDDYRQKMIIQGKKSWEDPAYREIQDMYHNSWSKTYVQTTLDNRLIKIWKSSKDLFANVNINPRCFWGCLSNQQATTGNYRFYYLEEYIDKFGSIHTSINDNEYIKALKLSKQQEKKIALQRKLKWGFDKRRNKEIKPYINIAKEVHSYISQFNSYIVCLTHNKIFDSIESANNFYNIHLTSDSIYSSDGQSFSGVYNSEPLVWTSFDKYVKMSKSEINSLILEAKQKMSHYYGSTCKPIVCVENDCAYVSLGYVENLGITSRLSIRRCLQGKQKTAGGYHWEYYYGGNPHYDEMIKNQEKELKDRMRRGKKK